MELQFDSAGISVLELGIQGCALFGLNEFYSALTRKGIGATKINHWTQAGGKSVLAIGTAGNRRIRFSLNRPGSPR
jgi:hypothetical protein